MGVEWSNYRHPLPQHMHDIYLRSLADVTFTSKREKDQSAVRGGVAENVAPLLLYSLLSDAIHEERLVDHIPLQRTTSLRGRRKLRG